MTELHGGVTWYRRVLEEAAGWKGEVHCMHGEPPTSTVSAPSVYTP